MKLQHTANPTTPIIRPLNGRRPAEKGLTFSTALLGIACVAGLFGALALLFHAG